MTAMISDSSWAAHGNDESSATAMLMQLLDAPGTRRAWVAVAALLLKEIGRGTLGDPGAVEGALARALDLAGPDQVPAPFLIHPPLGPHDRHARHHTSDAALTHGETRVLHYLPTNLSAREIAGELYLSVNTVKTHQRHLYQKLGARSRTQAVDQARALGPLEPFLSRAPIGGSEA
ncbi:MAG TPA: LuxR C-terminal-related transcriptional regulator [Trebonia sp.]